MSSIYGRSLIRLSIMLVINESRLNSRWPNRYFLLLNEIFLPISFDLLFFDF